MAAQVAILGDMHHPHILRLFGVAYRFPHAYVVTEQCWCSLLALLRAAGPVVPPFWTRVQWALDIAHAMDFLHDRGIVHRFVQGPLQTTSSCAQHGSTHTTVLLSFSCTHEAPAAVMGQYGGGGSYSHIATTKNLKLLRDLCLCAFALAGT